MKFPTVENAAFIMIDMQQKLLPAMCAPQAVLDRNILLLNAASAMNADVLVTEQYPKGLGNTVPELSTWLDESVSVIAKTSFSVFGSAEFCSKLLERKREVLIFSGQTVLIAPFVVISKRKQLFLRIRDPLEPFFPVPVIVVRQL